MTEIHIGSKIRELRKKKGITQEALAAVLTVTPQAVSKWESGVTYPDMAMIPAIARYFEVSLDVLFDYDVNEIKRNVEKIEEEARRYFYTDPKQYVDIIKEALNDYPGNEDLLFDLLNMYAGYDFTTIDGNDHIDEAIEIANRIISGSNHYTMICWAKERQAGIYLKKGEYGKAKEIYESLPHRDDIPTQNQSMAFMLSGMDKLRSATYYRNGSIEDLYIACEKMGDAWLTMNEHPEASFDDHTPADYIPEAIKCYRQAITVLESFMVDQPDLAPHQRYLWAGMQTFHWCFHQDLAACYKKLGQTRECEQEIETAYGIISTAWEDFETRRELYMDSFNRHLTKLGLEEYGR